MLYNVHACKLSNQYFVQMYRKLLMGQGSNIQKILYTVNDLFQMNPQLRDTFATQAYTYFLNKKQCNDYDWESEYDLFATYGVLMSGVCLGINIEDSSFKLYTSSISVLEGLAQRGILKGKKDPIDIELKKLQETLYGNRIKKTITDGDKYCVVRLDASMKGSSLQMKATIPRTLPSKDKVFFVPFSLYKDAMDYVYNLAQAHMLRVVMGDKVRDITLNREILGQIYGSARAKYLCSFIPNVYMQSLYLPSVGASKYTPGVTNISLEKVDAITQITLTDINLADVNLDFTGIKQYAKEVFDGMSEADRSYILGMLMQEDMDSFLQMYESEIWDIMNQHPDIFHPEVYRAKPSMFKDFISVAVPKSISDLETMLKEGAYRITITKSNGRFSMIYGTNNKKVLQKFLGKNYFKSYESAGVRAKAFISMNEAGYPDDTVSAYTGIASLEAAHEEAGTAFSRTTVVKQSHLVTVRSIRATSGTDYYKEVNLESIVDIAQIVS